MPGGVGGARSGCLTAPIPIPPALRVVVDFCVDARARRPGMKRIIILPTGATAFLLGIVAVIALTAWGGGDSGDNSSGSVIRAAACSSRGVDKSLCNIIATCDLFRCGCITYYNCRNCSEFIPPSDPCGLTVFYLSSR